MSVATLPAAARADGSPRPPPEAEVPFGFDEIFFSRTDPRGVMQAGNATFRRVSGFGWDRLIGAPHKIVRHPGTPRGVFHLMWERIKAGKPTGAYVRNRSEDGRSYWVLAVVVPLVDGFLSTRIKPGSTLFAEIRDLYADLLGEEAGGLAPGGSATLLQDRLKARGYATYDDFQAAALTAEASHRAGVIGRTRPRRVEGLSTAATAATQLEREATAMGAMFDVARNISINLRVLASSLGDLGRPVSAISVNYSLLSTDMTTWIATRALSPEDGFGQIARQVRESQFHAEAAEVLHELAVDFGRTAEAGGADPAVEAARLETLATDARARASAVLPRVARAAKVMESRVTEMRRHVTGLSSIRMLCRIEGAVLRAHGRSLDMIVAQLDSFQDDLEARLARISDLNLRLQAAADGI